MRTETLPELPLEAWEDTQITLHLWLQIVGKAKLALMPHRNHWWNITFLVSNKGLTSNTIPHEHGNFQFDFDFIQHRFELTTSWGHTSGFDLVDGLTVAGFHQKFFHLLHEIGVEVQIWGVPYDHPCKEPFAECETHSRYQKDYVNRFWRALVFVDNAFKEFSGRFYGKVSPSQLYWHHMDLAVTRFSGEEGPALPDTSTVADKEAYSHEVISAGFWSGDQNVRGAAFYAYVYPSPEGLDNEKLEPAAASWQDANGSPMAMLMYDDLLKSDQPKEDLLAFLESSYQAGAKLAQWPPSLNGPHATA